MQRIFVGRLVVVLCSVLAALGANSSLNGAANVAEHHNHDTRDGRYIDPAFTPAAAAGLKRDTNFSGVIRGNVYAQPLYIDGGPSVRRVIIAVTARNKVLALDAAKR